MYYGQRDKLISVRVSSELLNEVKKRIDSYTSISHGRGGAILTMHVFPVTTVLGAN